MHTIQEGVPRDLFSVAIISFFRDGHALLTLCPLVLIYLTCTQFSLLWP